MKTLWGAFFTLVVIIIFLTFANTIANEASEKNTRLDNTSIALIIDLNYETTIYNQEYVSEQENNVTANSTFEGVDPFARQYLEDKSEILQKKSQTDKILSVPDLLIRSMGIENNALVLSIKLLLVALMTFALGLAAYKAVRTGETG